MSKKTKLFLIFFIFSAACFAQDTIAVWNRHLLKTNDNTGPISGYGYQCTDKINNSFLLLDFNDTLKIGDSVFVNTNKKILSSVLIKIDNNNNISWTFNLANKTNIRISDLAADNNGGCYITGRYFGNFPITPTLTLDSTAIWGRSFFAHFSSNGQLAWAKGFPNAAILLIAPSQNGNIYLKRNASNGSYQLGDSTLAYSTKETIAKFDASGKFYWAKTFTPSDGIIADQHDNIYIYNDFNTKITVDTFQLTPNTTNRSDLFIAKINSKKEVTWVKQLENINKSVTTLSRKLLAIDDIGNIYFSSVFKDSMSVLGQKFYSPQYYKLFFIKIDSNGNYNWVKVSGGNQSLNESVSSLYFSATKKIKGKIYISNTTNFNGHSIPNIKANAEAYIEMDTNGIVSHLNALLLSAGSFSPGTGSSYFQYSMLAYYDSIKILGKFYKSVKKSDYYLIKYDTSFFSGIEPLNSAFDDVACYPNPVNSVCFINSEKYLINGLLLYNSLGALVCNFSNLNTNSYSLNVLTYPKGIYFLKINTNSGKFALKKLLIN